MAPVSEAVAASFNEPSSFLDSFGNHIAQTLSASASLLRRSTDFVPGVGVTPVSSINNTAVFVIIGLMGAGFIITAIWFFFRAKNGGFHFRQGDWEDYKSTVLRRKGPNGTTLSGATESTDLGGGSIVGKRAKRMRYKDVGDFESSIGTASEMSDIKAGLGGKDAKLKKKEEKQKRKKEQKEKKEKKEKKETEKSIPQNGGYEESVFSEQPDDAMRAYRHEKPAKVGGMNRLPEGSAFEGSTADSQSDLLSHRQSTPTNTPTKKARHEDSTSDAGVRQVEPSRTFWDSPSKKSAEKANKEREEKIKEEAKKLQEKGRAARSTASSGRRDFSYTAGDDASSTVSSSAATEERRVRRERRQSRSPEKRLAGSYASSDAGTDATGTKSYHHPIPGLSSNYAEERRKKRAGAGGYRRGRGDEPDDD
ncbi:MAG: hypothetical protein M1818_005653 [Claussenomyces sp. TS43310]|nr:MAG: hypothetical protein M1818_005653 [Claussenomyces sp. TS43310]